MSSPFEPRPTSPDAISLAHRNLAADDSAGGNLSRAESELKQMADFGVNTVRIMAASEGAPTVQPYRMYPALLESPYHWNEDIFVGLDRCIAKMGDLGQKGILGRSASNKQRAKPSLTDALRSALADTWHWSGGFGQYVSWTYGNNESIPYPPSWDPNLNPPFGDCEVFTSFFVSLVWVA